MKKNNIFRHELNESIQATAAMNCLKNRNKHQQNEGFLMTAGIWVLKKIVFHLVMKAIKKYGSQIDFSKVMDSVANGLAEQKGALQKAVGKAVNGWQDLPEKYKKQITELAKEKFNELKTAAGEKINQLTSKGQPQLANQEQEEDTLNAYYSQDEPDYENDHHGIWLIINLMRKQGMLRAQGIEGRDDVDDGHAIDAAYDLIEQKLNEEGMWIGDDDHEAERFVSFFGEEIAAEAMKSAIHNQQSQEQEENSLDTEYFSDLEEQEAYYENFRAIAELVADQIDRENGKDIANNMDTLFEIVREVWNNNPDDLYIWDFDDVQEDDCYKFFDKYYETIKNEYLKREHNNIMAATHDDLFDF